MNPVALATTLGTNHLSLSTYDERGNLILYPTSNPQETLSYDLLNRQYGAADSALGNSTYIYDGAGERVGKFPTLGGATRREFAQ